MFVQHQVRVFPVIPAKKLFIQGGGGEGGVGQDGGEGEEGVGGRNSAAT